MFAINFNINILNVNDFGDGKWKNLNFIGTVCRVIVPGAYKRTFVFFFYRLKYVYMHHINAIIALQSAAYLSYRVQYRSTWKCREIIHSPSLKVCWDLWCTFWVPSEINIPHWNIQILTFSPYEHDFLVEGRINVNILHIVEFVFLWAIRLS